MDKNAIKKYAIWARRELIDRVTKRAAVFGVSKEDVGDPNADNVNGHLLSDAEKRQRQALIRRIEEKGYEQVMEEVAYTWFNRFAALRFMEVNGYLPTHIRVFTDDEGRFRPQILSEAIHLDLDGLNKPKVYQLKDSNQEEELFKYLLIVQCNALNGILPGMFQKIEDYTELLLPDYLLREGSVIEQMVTLIPEDDWKDQVQIIGWLYQYYNTEPKDKVFADLKKNIKISKEHIPAATQLFTPDWIVHYMVENSLGRLWLEGHPNNELKSKWKYYLDEAEQEPDVQAQLAEIRKQYAALKPEEILTIDPCAGSGHILCLLFDVLVRIYEDYGYTAREAAASIVQNNLWGLDIDDRAAQLAYFAVMMKARQYDRRFFTREVQPHVYAIQESNGIHRDHLHYLGRGMSDIERNNARNQMNTLLDEFIDAKEYGSILQPGVYDWALLSRFVADITPDQQVSFDESGVEATQAQLRLMIAQGQALAQKYHAVVTNPPYMALTNTNSHLSDYVNERFLAAKSDLYSVFIKRCESLAKMNMYYAMITQQSWISLPSFIFLRKEIFAADMAISMAQMGSRAFDEISGEVVSSISFVLRRGYIGSYRGVYLDLQEGLSEAEKERMFINREGYYETVQDNFSLIPNNVVVYNASSIALKHFQNDSPLSSIVAAKPGMQTSDNDRFLRIWYEVGFSGIGFRFDHEMARISEYKWFPYNKGIGYRKWYGNNDYIVNFYHDGEELKYWLVHNPNDPKTKHWSRNMRNYDSYFEEGITFTAIGNAFSARMNGKGYLFDTKGPMIFGSNLPTVCGFVNSIVFDYYNKMLCKQLTKTFDSVNLVPFAFIDDLKQNQIINLVNENLELSKSDWDSFETSWDFQRHPLVTPAIDQHYMLLSDCWRDWERTCADRFAQLKANEEELNRIFIDIYGLQDELTPDVDDKDVTVRKADLGRDIRSLISYAVGCMVGRYSLDKPGLAFAGGAWDASQYVAYPADKDGILPITDDEYFADDIVTMFVNWLKTVYGADTLEENLRFISDALGGKGSPREVIRNYFLNDFYKDHLKVYQKRPIYWLFDSGKKNGFKALVYMHRYQPDTIARVRTDYVHEMQSRYRTAIADVEQRLNDASTSERVKLTKRLNALQAQADELRQYEEKIHHLADQMIAIDLDDGVKVNYAKFADVLATIK